MKYSTAIILLCLIGFFIYANSLTNGFVWDDEEQIVNNTVIRSWQNLPLLFSSSTFYAGGAGLSGGFYRPLVTLSYMLNYSVWGSDAFGFRLFQIFFHLINVILIFFLLQKIFRIHKVEYGNRAAFLAALLFAVHPANVESVVYVGSIGEIFYAMFVILALLVMLDGIDHKARMLKNKNLS